MKSLNAGTDLLFPTKGGTTLAVRYFDLQRITKLEADPATAEAKKGFVQTFQRSPSSSPLWNYDFDQIKSFRDAFQHTAVFFIFPPDKMMQQLTAMDSILKLLQASLAHFPTSDAHPNITSGDDESSRNQKAKAKGCARLFIVPDHASALNAIGSIQESLTPAKIKSKQQFFKTEREKMLHVNVERNNSSLNTMSASEISALSSSIPPDAAGKLASKAFRSWATKAGISLADANVVMSVMGSLKRIVESAANDDGSGLEDVPVEEWVKRTIIDFFGSSTSTAMKNHHHGQGQENGQGNGNHEDVAIEDDDVGMDDEGIDFGFDTSGPSREWPQSLDYPEPAQKSNSRNNTYAFSSSAEEYGSHVPRTRGRDTRFTNKTPTSGIVLTAPDHLHNYEYDYNLPQQGPSYSQPFHHFREPTMDVEPSRNHHIFQSNSTSYVRAHGNRTSGYAQNVYNQSEQGLAPPSTRRQHLHPIGHSQSHAPIPMDHSDRNRSLSQPMMHSDFGMYSQTMQEQHQSYGHHPGHMMTPSTRTPHQQHQFLQQPSRSVRQRTSRGYTSGSQPYRNQNRPLSDHYRY